MSNSTTHSEYTVGEADDRPWGRWEVKAVGDDYIVKEIMVKPGSALSLQRHQFRDEYWTCLTGAGEVTLDEEVIPFKAGDNVFIKRGVVHRITTSDNEVRFVEIQTGDRLDENDIERLEDRYGR